MHSLKESAEKIQIRIERGRLRKKTHPDKPKNVVVSFLASALLPQSQFSFTNFSQKFL